MLNDTLRAAYLDYSNNYLTARVYAEHNGISETQARAVIELGRALHESHVAALREVQATQDPWTQGYRAARDHGATYSDNPLEGQKGASAWAFGCSEGMRARNAAAFDGIVKAMRES